MMFGNTIDDILGNFMLAKEINTKINMSPLLVANDLANIVKKSSKPDSIDIGMKFMGNSNGNLDGLNGMFG